MKYVLADLMRVRNLRKDRAERELKHAREHLAQAKSMVLQREKELHDFEIWVDQEIDRQYNEVLKKQVRKGSVDDLQANIRLLKGRMLEYVKRLNDAKEEVRKAEDNVKIKHEEVLKANRELEKLDEHKKLWIEEQKKLEELLGDREMEEVKTKGSGNGETPSQSRAEGNNSDGESEENEQFEEEI